MTHAELITRGERWLLNTVGCGFVLKEMSAGIETADIIGWKWGESILIECKASRADFLRDKDKYFRQYPEYGMGRYRFYLCPPDMIKEKDLPEKWGLLYAYPKIIKKIVHPNMKGGNMWHNPAFIFDSTEQLNAEITLLTSALRRVKENGDFDVVYQQLERKNENGHTKRTNTRSFCFDRCGIS
jgi:hypothetical protein